MTGTITTQAGNNVTIHGNGVVLSGVDSSRDLIDLGANATLNIDHATLQHGNAGVNCAGEVCADQTVNAEAVTATDLSQGLGVPNVNARDSVMMNNQFGIYGSTVTLVNSTVANNRNGVLYGINATILSSTIANNSVVGIGRGGNPQPPIIEASILANNAVNCFTPAVDHGLNLSTDDSCGFDASTSKSLVSSDDLALGALGYYGGTTQSIPLLAGSIAINAIPHNDPPTPSVLCYNTVESRAVQDPGTSENIVVDQRGVSRVADAGCDIGAYEATVIGSTTSATAVSARATDDSVTIPVTLSATCPVAGPCDAPNQGIVTVHIATSDGTSIGTDATATVSGGAASASYALDDPALGDYNVTISYHDATGLYGDSQTTTTLTIVPGPPATISLSPGSTSLQVGTYVTEVASVTDANGNPVADGTPMHWLVYGVPHSNISREDYETTGGSATLSYTSTDAGLHDFSVEAGNPYTAHASGYVTFTPGPAASITLVPSDTAAVVGTSATVTAQVVDQYGNDVADSTPVNFRVSGMNTTSATRNTFFGNAEFSYSSDLPGVDTVTATSGNATPAQASVTWSPPGSTQRASLTIINPVGTSIMAMVSTDSNGTVNGTLTYRSSALTLSQVQLTALVVDGNQAALYGTATVNGANVSFRLDASARLRRGTVRLRLSNGYDSGNQPVMGLRVR